MEKIFYLQYQYLPYYMAALTIPYLLPYIVFVKCNHDLVRLREIITEPNADVNEIVQNFFKYRMLSKARMRLRVLLNIFVKLLYIAANSTVIISTNYLLNGDFLTYGIEWVKWSQLGNALSHNHNMKQRVTPKPGNILLPPMGFCEIHEASRDIRKTFTNKHKFICEINSHILYQYVMMVLWFLLMLGFLLSCFGLLCSLFRHVVNCACLCTGSSASRRMYRVLTAREIEYLDHVRRRSIPLYTKLTKKLSQEREDMASTPSFMKKPHMIYFDPHSNRCDSQTVL